MNKIILILFLLSSITLSAEDFWEYLYGPNIGVINVIEISEKTDIFFIGTTNGIFKSTNNGKSWVQVFKGEDIKEIAINKEGVIFAKEIKQQLYYYVYISEDDGGNWKEIKTLNGNPYPWGLIFLDDNTLFMFDEYIKDSIITYYSNNNGQSWYRNIFINDFTGYYIPFISDINKNANRIVIGGNYEINYDYYGFILISNDTGKTWQKIEGIPVVKSIIFITDDHILAGTGHGLFITTNRGKSWAYTIFTDNIGSIFIDKESSIYLSSKNALYVSKDLGYNWKILSEKGSYRNIISDKDGNLYGSLAIGFYYSTNKGVDWIQSNNGFTADNVKSIAYDKEGNIYTVSYGVHKSTDNGDSWECIGLYDKSLTVIAINDKGHIFTSSNLIGYGIFRSTDNGKTWEQFIEGLAVSSGKPAPAEALFINKRGHIYYGTEFYGYWSSTNNGETWQRVKAIGGSFSFQFNPVGYILRGGYKEGICLSKDDGDSWSIASPENENLSSDVQTRRIAIYKDGFGFTWNSFQYTNDGGLGWVDAFEPSYKAGMPAIDSLGNLITVSSRGKVWRMLRPSNVLEDISSGLFHTSFNTISVAPNGYIYLAAENGGLYRSKQKYVSVIENPIPSNNLILQCQPNPFSESTTISYSLPSPSHIKLSIYDIFGREVAVLVEGWQEAGENIYHLPFNIYHLSDGIYFCRLQVGGESKVIKIVKIE